MKHLLFLLIIVPATFFGQTYLGIGANLGGFIRAGNWADTYGSGFETGGRIEFGSNQGFILAAQGDAMFGQNVKIDPLTNLRNDVGVITGDIVAEGTLADISLKSRGFRASMLVGYQRQLHENGIGFRVLAGPSYLMHYIRIQDDANQSTNNLRDEYKRGYDRRAAGYGAYGELGIQYVEQNGSFRLYGVLTGSFTATSALNNTQFDLQQVAPNDGTDISFGGRIGLILGLFRSISSEKADDIYY